MPVKITVGKPKPKVKINVPARKVLTPFERRGTKKV